MNAQGSGAGYSTTAAWATCQKSTWKLQGHGFEETASITVDLPLSNHLLSSKMSVWQGYAMEIGEWR